MEWHSSARAHELSHSVASRVARFAHSVDSRVARAREDMLPQCDHVSHAFACLLPRPDASVVCELVTGF